MRVAELPTPQVLIDRRRAAANIATMQRIADAGGLALRPHAKTHKSPTVARWQLDQGAVGICCAKLGEAEVFVEAGIEDIRLAYPLNPSNGERLLRLVDRARLSFIVDHPAVASAWSDLLHAKGRIVDVLVKVDVGFHRCGVDPASPGALHLLQLVDTLPGLRLRGLLSHPGHAYEARSEAHLREIAASEAGTLRDVADRARESGIAIEEISVGSTPTARFSATERGLTELRPGNYVYFDRSQVGLGAATLDDCALTVMATIVSRPAPDRLILDCGSKTLTTDRARGFADSPGFGAVFADLEATAPAENWLIERLSEEHAIVRVPPDTIGYAPGHRVRVLPNHSCVVSNVVDCVRLVDEDQVIETLPVAARGRIT